MFDGFKISPKLLELQKDSLVFNEALFKFHGVLKIVLMFNVTIILRLFGYLVLWTTRSQPTIMKRTHFQNGPSR